jgi:hypothetical protein
VRWSLRTRPFMTKHRVVLGPVGGDALRQLVVRADKLEAAHELLRFLHCQPMRAGDVPQKRAKLVPPLSRVVRAGVEDEHGPLVAPRYIFVHQGQRLEQQGRGAGTRQHRGQVDYGGGVGGVVLRHGRRRCRVGVHEFWLE